MKALPDGEPVQLTRDQLDKMSPMFSPDGSRVAYTVVDKEFTWNAWTVPVVGGEPQLWLKNASGLSWTDPAHVLFSEITDTGIHMRVATGTAIEPLRGRSTIRRTRSGWLTAPCSRQIAHRYWSSMVSNVFRQCRLVPSDGAAPGKGVGPAGQCTAAAWSPDGRWMYFSAKVNGVFHLWRQRPPDGTPEQLTSGPTEEEGVAVAPDGRSLFTSLGTVQSAVWVHDARGDHEVSGEGNAFVPSGPPVVSQPFSADGRKLLYLVRQGMRHVGVDQRSGALWMVDLESERRTPLFPGFDVTAYDLSRDGTRVVFSALDDLGRSHLWLGRLDGQLPPRQSPPSRATARDSVPATTSTSVAETLSRTTFSVCRRPASHSALSSSRSCIFLARLRMASGCSRGSLPAPTAATTSRRFPRRTDAPCRCVWIAKPTGRRTVTPSSSGIFLHRSRC